jgi:DNA-binding NarL/FixJ family response regulator
MQLHEVCSAHNSPAAPRCSLASAETRRAIRLAAIAADSGATHEFSVVDLWRELAQGECWVVLELFSEDRCYLVLASTRDELAPSLEGRRLEILQAVLGGLPQNNVAIDWKLAPSTVALYSRLGLESFGVSGRPSRAHPLLMLAARAASERAVALARCSTFAINEHQLRVVSAPRPDLHLKATLPPAELAVVRHLVEGHTYAEIAAERGTAARTIANQIAAVFRRLRVSGRNELLQRLLFDEGLIGPFAQSAETLPPPQSTARGRQEPWTDTRRSA